MAHSAKYPASSTGKLCQHYERKQNENGEYIKFKNQDIDLTRTHLNYNLAPEREGGQIAFINKRKAEVHCLKRSDVNVMCSWVVTVPKPDDFGNYGRLDGISSHSQNREDIQRLFFERTYQFLADRYGEQNVISAYVHMDEATPHMHFAYIPVVADEKHGYTVSAKKLLTLRELNVFHPDLERFHDSFRDWKFEVLNEATKDGNKEISELKAETARQEAVEARKTLERVQGDINQAEGRKRALEGEIMALQTKKETLTAAEVDAVKGTKTILGGVKDLNYNAFEALKRTAAKAEMLEAERDRAVRRAQAAERNAEVIKESAENQIREIRATANADKPSIKLQMEHAALKSRFEKMVERLNKLLEILPAQIKTFIQDILADRDPFRQRQDRGHER